MYKTTKKNQNKNGDKMKISWLKSAHDPDSFANIKRMGYDVKIARKEINS